MQNRSQIPSLRLHKPSGKAVATIGGRDYYFGPWGPHNSRPAPAARAAYDLAIARWLAEGRPSCWSANSGDVAVAELIAKRSLEGQQCARSSGPPDITIAELMLEYIRYADARYRRPDGTPTGHIGNVKLALRPLRRLYGNTPARQFNSVMPRACAVEAIADSIRPNPLTGEPRRQKPLARRVANQRARLIRRMFKWAAARQRVDASVPVGLMNFEAIYAGEQLDVDGRFITAQDPPPSRLLSQDNYQRTIEYLPPLVRALIETLRLTGARLSEACSMRTADIEQTGPTWVYRPRWHKNSRRGMPREIQIGPRAQALLRAWLRLDAPEAFIFSPSRTVELMRETGARNDSRNDLKRKGTEKDESQNCADLPARNTTAIRSSMPSGGRRERRGSSRGVQASCDICGQPSSKKNSVQPPLRRVWATRQSIPRSATTSSSTPIRHVLQCCHAAD